MMEAKVNIRPYAKNLIENLSQNFDIGVFTAAVDYYAQEIVRFLDPKRKHIKVILSREDCHEIYQNIYVKDLRIIKNRNASRVFLVDNCAYSYAYQMDNGIPIISYHEGKDDAELRYLEQYLYCLDQQEDAQTFNRNYFGTHNLAEETHFPEAFSKIMNFNK